MQIKPSAYKNTGRSVSTDRQNQNPIDDYSIEVSKKQKAFQHICIGLYQQQIKFTLAFPAVLRLKAPSGDQLIFPFYAPSTKINQIFLPGHPQHPNLWNNAAHERTPKNASRFLDPTLAPIIADFCSSVLSPPFPWVMWRLLRLSLGNIRIVICLLCSFMRPLGQAAYAHPFTNNFWFLPFPMGLTNFSYWASLSIDPSQST